MLKEYREEIRELDEKILELIERRLEIARTIAEYKMDRDIPVTDAAQEENVIDHVVSLAKREDDVPYIRRFWRMMLENSRAVQHKVVTGDNITGLWLREMIRSAAKRKENPRVVYKGGEGSYGHEAAAAYFGTGGFGGCSTYEKVCRTVKNGDADYAVLPLESNTAGAMPGVRELINKYGLYIAGEQNVRLDDCLAAPKGARLEDITEIHAHEQVLARCSAFLEDHPEIKAVPSLSSSKCVKKIAEENSPHKAVITSGFAAELNGLEVIAPYISDNPGSCTRFVILTDKFEISPGGDKVSMAFTVRHRAGALQRVLGIFADYHLNLSKIESVPVGGADFEYLFFTDFTGDIAQANTQKALALVEQECDFLRILGNYKSKRRNIVLVGMPGSGKNAVGKALALQIGMEYYDTDGDVEKGLVARRRGHLHRRRYDDAPGKRACAAAHRLRLLRQPPRRGDTGERRPLEQAAARGRPKTDIQTLRRPPAHLPRRRGLRGAQRRRAEPGGKRPRFDNRAAQGRLPRSLKYTHAAKNAPRSHPARGAKQGKRV